jgi:hypothetical protein
VATAEPEQATLLSSSTRARSVRLSSPVYRGATPSPNLFRWREWARPELGADSYEATQSYDRPGIAPVASAIRRRSSTRERCASLSPLPADAGSD